MALTRTYSNAHILSSHVFKHELMATQCLPECPPHICGRFLACEITLNPLHCELLSILSHKHEGQEPPAELNLLFSGRPPAHPNIHPWPNRPHMIYLRHVSSVSVDALCSQSLIVHLLSWLIPGYDSCQPQGSHTEKSPSQVSNLRAVILIGCMAV